MFFFAPVPVQVNDGRNINIYNEKGICQTKSEEQQVYSLQMLAGSITGSADSDDYELAPFVDNGVIYGTSET